jgi:hypothetical protein
MKWLDRSLMQCSYYYGLCTDEAAFKRELRRMKVPADQWPNWISNEQSDATVHYLENDGRKAAIVCIRVDESRTGIEVAGLLVHEAVHIWQAHCDDIGEKSPASEQEAYAVQGIAQSLMQAYSESLTQ